MIVSLANPLPPAISGTVIAVSRSARHGFCKEPQPGIRLIAGEGVEGDAHRGATVQHLFHLRRDPTRPNLCQVHLFAAEMLAELATRGFPLAPGEIGENILTRDLDLLRLPGSTRLHLSPDAVVEVTGLRTPCNRMDKHRAGLQQHLWGAPAGANTAAKRERRAGIMAIVLQGGFVHPGAVITVELPPLPHLPLGPI